MTYARIHENLGDFKLANKFAKFGLDNLGSGFGIKPELERLAALS